MSVNMDQGWKNYISEKSPQNSVDYPRYSGM